MPIIWIGSDLPKTREQGAGRGYCYARRESNLKQALCARNFLTRPPAFSEAAGVVHCAHRATTASSWGLCEQEGPWPLPFPHPSSLVLSQGWGLIDLPLRASMTKIEGWGYG